MASESTFLQAPGEPVDSHSIEKARDLAEQLSQGNIAYAEFIESRKTATGEVVVFDVEVELGQLKVHDIRKTERISVEFSSGDTVLPDVLALRDDFPLVPHTNLRTQEFPRSLCLYDQPYRELKRQWTAPRFVERIRWWLARTAKGKLHGDDQPLEPLVFSHSGTIVVPYFLTQDEGEQFRPLYVHATSLKEGDAFYIASTNRPAHARESGAPFAACIFTCPPQQHGVIRQQPETLAELAQFVGEAGFDLISSLRKQAADTKADFGREAGPFLDAPLIVIIRFPKTRTESGPIESTDVRVFLTLQSVRNVGIDIGVWEAFGDELAAVMQPTEDQDGSNVKLSVLSPVYEFDPSWATVLNGHKTGNYRKIAAIGAGALGSQVIMNAARAGLGLSWTVIDEDRLYPHNLARHALCGVQVGYHKAELICWQANDLTPETKERFSAIVADVLRPGDKAEDMTKALQDSDTILDMSASVNVARHLSHAVTSDAQRMSLFLNPTGADLVLLAEGDDRGVPLDALEMQYYRAIVNHEGMRGHFESTDGRQRYGQSCRDVTITISQELVALHAATGSSAVRTYAGSDAPQISIWRASPNHSVTRVDVPVTAVSRMTVGDWTLSIDSHVCEQMAKLRSEKIPNETGGVLLGSFDLERRIAYVVELLPSPPDSEEWPTLYIRGCKGLRKSVEAIHNNTDGMLHYVGEWHSHPDGCSTLPSRDDMQVFAWLTERMNADGYPALMMIAGQGNACNCFIGKIERIENLVPFLQDNEQSKQQEVAVEVQEIET